MGACTGPEPINYLEALFPEAPKFSAHKSDLHNRAEWIVDITTRVSPLLQHKCQHFSHGTGMF